MIVFADPVVDWDALGQVILYSVGAGVGVSLVFSLAIVGAARFGEARAGGRHGEATGYALMAGLGLAATVACVVVAIIVMTNKS